MAGWLEGTFAALRVRSFRILWIGTLLSFVAFFMSTIVNSVVAFDLSGTNRAVGTVVFAQGVAMALLGPLGGAFADRWPKRRVAVLGQLNAAATFGTIALLLYLDAIHLLALAAASFLIGGTFAFLGPARMGLAIELVSDALRGNAMALSNVANTASRVVGPAVAGALLGWPLAGPVGAYATMALLYVCAALSMSWLPKSQVRAGASDRHVFADVVDGYRYVWARRRLRLLMIFFVSVILVGFPHVTVLPGLIEHAFGLRADRVSELFVSSAVGALSASISVAQFADSPRALLLYTVLGMGFGVSLVGLAVSPSFFWAAVAMFLVGAASGGFQALNGAVIARATEPMYIGRVMSLTLLAFAGFGLMALPMGLLADAAGERVALAASGSGVIALSIVLGVALSRLPDEGEPT